eukprot:TRINITY_DN14869_c0_g1_i1.p1 TRINITY_DN14869_c0_g1~~TRINITY_DN14869_c0_g1_i1.p1  ORF type:complete len:366 (+),score=40.83 TRINITY_DN14869_c0_g1_i1:50-1099(+)
MLRQALDKGLVVPWKFSFLPLAFVLAWKSGGRLYAFQVARALLKLDIFELEEVSRTSMDKAVFPAGTSTKIERQKRLLLTILWCHLPLPAFCAVILAVYLLDSTRTNLPVLIAVSGFITFVATIQILLSSWTYRAIGSSAQYQFQIVHGVDPQTGELELSEVHTHVSPDMYGKEALMQGSRYIVSENRTPPQRCDYRNSLEMKEMMMWKGVVSFLTFSSSATAFVFEKYGFPEAASIFILVSISLPFIVAVAGVMAKVTRNYQWNGLFMLGQLSLRWKYGGYKWPFAPVSKDVASVANIITDAYLFLTSSVVSVMRVWVLKDDRYLFLVHLNSSILLLFYSALIAGRRV